MKARRKGTNEPFQKVASVCLCSGGYILIKDVEFEQDNADNASDRWQEKDSTMAFSLMRDVEQISFLSKEGKDERIGWLNTLEDRFCYPQTNSEIDHWQEVRERASMLAMQSIIPTQKGEYMMCDAYKKYDDCATEAVEYADALVKKLKGE